MKKYLMSYIDRDTKKFYSLNLLYSKIVTDSLNGKKQIKPLTTVENKYRGKNVVIERYYKNISTIFNIQGDEDENNG